jgi:hypothetical protein
MAAPPDRIRTAGEVVQHRRQEGVGYANSHVGCELGFRGSVAWYGWRLWRPACGGHPGCYLDSPTSRCAAPSDCSCCLPCLLGLLHQLQGP